MYPLRDIPNIYQIILFCKQLIFSLKNVSFFIESNLNIFYLDLLKSPKSCEHKKGAKRPVRNT